MPRVIDFSHRNQTEWSESRLPEPVYGEREIRPEELIALSEAFNSPVTGFTPQFSTYGRSIDLRSRAELPDDAHKFLSENMTGPWLWSEHWANHGHSLDLAVYIERRPDQERFLAAFGETFGFTEPSSFDLGCLAVNRGVLPPLTALESFSKWGTKHSGFRWLPAEDIGPRGMRVAFDHAGLEAEFVARWGDRMIVRETDEGRLYEADLTGTSWRDDPSGWLGANSAVGSIAGRSSIPGEPYKWVVETRFADVAAALKRDWGHFFKPDATGLIFSADEYPRIPERVVPDDFLAYLRGEAEDFAAPHLSAIGGATPVGPAP
ncbi:conserved hypothetical protein [Hyphomicrobiales bacterium]|jgi:hypothetical protein|nr:conserved hypothetical protein [Hyphomicrobiales bacterium]CAH1702375.1 conserved hypothetical protein [Hyphomicrobiales bacterium]CAI0346575.1 conserved hypothetical protein [Hyphomicrobiales bacterium]